MKTGQPGNGFQKTFFLISRIILAMRQICLQKLRLNWQCIHFIVVFPDNPSGKIPQVKISMIPFVFFKQLNKLFYNIIFIFHLIHFDAKI